MPTGSPRLAPIHEVSDPDTLQALAHPIRVRVLDALREPLSAAEVGRRIGLPRQLVNYHLKALDEAGLVRRTGERRTGNFIEILYQAVARSFVVSPAVAWTDPRRAQIAEQELSLRQLLGVGQQVERDALVLLDSATFDGATVASASVLTEVRFANERERSAFLRQYVAALGRLVKRFGTKSGSPYRIALAAYPKVDEAGGDE